MDTLTSLRVFVTVAELRSFTAAAARLGLSPAMVSKHVLHLEAKVAARLLSRTSRSVGLTEMGALYLDQARHAIETLDEAEAAVGNAAVAPRGTLRISAPVWMANPSFTAILAAYQRLYPQMQIDVDLSGRLVNLVEEGFDIALRIAAMPDSGLVRRLLAKVVFMLVAAPDFLDRTGWPTAIGDLEGRELLAYSIVPADGRMSWEVAGRRRSVRFRPVLRSGNEHLLYLAAKHGMGLAFLPKILVESDLASGTLIPVFADAVTVEVSLFAVYPSRRYLSAKVRTFIDHLAEHAKPAFRG